MAKKRLFDEDGNEVKGKIKKPFYKKWWFWLLVVLFIFVPLSSGNEDTPETNVAKESAEPIEETSVEESIVMESEKEELESSAVVVEEESKEELPAPSEVQFDPNDYITDLTYEDLARSPEEHSFKAVVFEGRVIQVMQGDGMSQYRVSINDDINQVMLIEVDNSQLTTRILEDDYIRFYGTYFGEITYESVLGGNITIPGVVVEKFEFL